jgi:NAD(P)-dependent dehydrogenase (short-subunit alcohol dehydrogenase family)
MRVALITRADERSGLEIARQLAGGDVALLLGCRNAQSGAEAAATLRAEGFNAVAMLIDETQPDSIARAALKIDADFGRLDLLVNHAEVPVTAGMRELLSKSDIGRVIEVRDDSLDQIRRLAPGWFEWLR